MRRVLYFHYQVSFNAVCVFVSVCLCDVYLYYAVYICDLMTVNVITNRPTFSPPKPASRRALILLVETRKLLKTENHAYMKEIEVLERNLNKCEEDESKLRGITQSQSSSVDELVRLVLDNEKTLDMIRVRRTYIYQY